MELPLGSEALPDYRFVGLFDGHPKKRSASAAPSRPWAGGVDILSCPRPRAAACLPAEKSAALAGQRPPSWIGNGERDTHAGWEPAKMKPCCKATEQADGAESSLLEGAVNGARIGGREWPQTRREGPSRSWRTSRARAEVVGVVTAEHSNRQGRKKARAVSDHRSSSVVLI